MSKVKPVRCWACIGPRGAVSEVFMRRIDAQTLAELLSIDQQHTIQPGTWRPDPPKRKRTTP